MPATPKLHRWLDLVAFLAARRVPVSVQAILAGVPGYAERRDSSDETVSGNLRRMFERDKSELRDLGIPIETVPGGAVQDGAVVDGYLMRASTIYLPVLRLLGEETGPSPRPLAGSSDALEVRPAEVSAAVEGLLQLAELPDSPLRDEARSAWRKLTFDLDPTRFRPAPVQVVAPPGAVDTAAATASLTDAILRCKRVTCVYHGFRRAEATERRVRPFGLLFRRARWYLVGHDEDRDALRVFRVARMRDVEVNRARPGTPDFTVPEDFSVATRGRRQPWELEWDSADEPDPSPELPEPAVVRFVPARAEWAERNDLGRLLEARPDGSALRAFEVRDAPAFLNWILEQEGAAVIESPAELRARAQAVALDLAERHAAPSPAEPPSMPDPTERHAAPHPTSDA
jgi:proteasome accessory factor B